ncbi:RluA family pseudouridine synthase [Candidatus Uhrbacteria bacterium]|nr:RluA family pseudouridine synthase [Candidatus Uhrbacteria bacterium]
MPEIRVTQKQSNERLDRFLTSTMETTRSQIQKLIEAGSVLVNREVAKSNRRLEEGDVIFYPEVELSAHKKTETAPLLEIVYQDDDVLVINKPSGLLVHEAFKDEMRATVVDALLESFPEVAEVGDDPKRPGIVHRLDKDVSGLMAIAKTQAGFDHLKHQFQARTLTKEYLALVYGALPKDHDVITLRVTRSKSKGRMVARPESQEGKEAHTEYDVLERLPTTTYVRVKILTGRTHQIRVHFQALGYPIVGDKLYKVKGMKFRPIELSRLFLHASKLTLRLMDGREKTFEAGLPDELERLLRSLKK